MKETNPIVTGCYFVGYPERSKEQSSIVFLVVPKFESVNASFFEIN